MLNQATTPAEGCAERIQVGQQLAVELWKPDGRIDKRFRIAMPRASARSMCSDPTHPDACPRQLPALDPDVAQGFGAYAFNHGWWKAVDHVLGPKRTRNTDPETVADRYWTWSPVGVDCAMRRIQAGQDVNQTVGYCRGQTCLMADRLPSPWRKIALVAAGVGAVALGVYLAR